MRAVFNIAHAGFWYGFMFVVVLANGLAGCKKKPDDPPTPGGALPAEGRLRTLEECRAKFRALDGIPTAAAREQLVTWLKSRPEFEAAGIAKEENNVWARFTDGRFLMFINNRETVPPAERGGRVGADTPPTAPAPGGRTGELPLPVQATLMNGLGTYYIDETGAIASIIRAAKTGYQVTTSRASVDNLKKVQGEGIFFLSTHGGRAMLRRSPGDTARILGFWTTDSVTTANEARFAADLDQDNLGYAIAPHDAPTAGFTVEKHYAFTAGFVDKYMKFGDNALICFSACNSFRESAEGEEFRNAILKKPGAYVGWTKAAKSQNQYVASQFLFDRLLGANGGSSTNFPIPKEDPPQRPFDVDAVFADLVAKGLSSSVSVDENGEVISAKLKLDNRTKGDKKLILAPSISFLEIDEAVSELNINGIFGTDPRPNGRNEVTVGGEPVTIKTWEPDRIVCQIPFEYNKPGSAGDVVVIARGHQSNAVPLTEWQIEYTQLAEQSPFVQRADIVLHLRADVHRIRQQPGDKNPLRVRQADVTFPLPQKPFAKDSKATLTFAGSCTYSCPRCTGQSAVVGPTTPLALPYYSVRPANGTNGFIASYGWDAERKGLTVYAFGGDVSSYGIERGPCPTGVSRSAAFQVFIGESLTVVPQKPLKLELANPDGFDFTVKASSQPVVTISGSPFGLLPCNCDAAAAPVPTRLSWKVATPRPGTAPTARTTARVGLTQ